MLSREQMHQLIRAKLKELQEAVSKLCRQTVHTPLPSGTVVNSEIKWPGSEGRDLWKIEIKGQKEVSKHNLDPISPLCVERICEACGYQPAKILKVIRCFDATVEWCRKKAEEVKLHPAEAKSSS